MPVDTSIYQSLLQPPKSLIGYANEMDQADLARSQLAQQKLNLIGAQQDYQDQQKLRQLYAQPGFDPNKAESLPQIFAISPKAGAAAQKSMLDAQKTQADIGHLQAQTTQAKAATSASEFDLVQKKLEHATSAIASSVNPDAARQAVQASIQQGYFTADEGRQKLASIPDDPGQFQQWRQQQWQSVLAAKDALAQQAQQAQQQETARHNKASEGIQVRGQNMTSETARLGRETQLKLGGYDANGNMLGGDGGAPLNGLVDAIGTYKTPEGVALGRIPPAMKSQVLSQVLQKYPDYDPSTYTARQKAARDFSTGQQGNALRSFAVAGDHLDQLGTLIDNLDNKNNQTWNKVTNAVSAWNGGTAPTNFDAAKDVVSKEVVKAIVGNGGGVSERAELKDLLDNAKSPAQLKGVVTQYRQLMAAQHEHLLQQRRGAGLPDSTLPDYSKPVETSAPAGWSYVGPVKSQ